MATDTKIGGAFIEIGGDDSKLRAAMDESARFTERSLQAAANLASGFAKTAADGFTGVTATIAKSTGAIGTFISAISAIASATEASTGFRASLANRFVTGGKADDLEKQIRQLAKGVPGTTGDTALNAAIAAMTAGVAPIELPEMLEMAVGVMGRSGGKIGFADAAAQVARPFATGKGTVSGIPLDQFSRRSEAINELRRTLLPAAKIEREIFAKRLGSGLASSFVSDVIDSNFSVLRAAGEFVNEQIGPTDTEVEQLILQSIARERGIGPTAGRLGYRTGADIPQSNADLRATNRLEVERLLAFEPQGPLIDKKTAFIGEGRRAAEGLSNKELMSVVQSIGDTSGGGGLGAVTTAAVQGAILSTGASELADMIKNAFIQAYRTTFGISVPMTIGGPPARLVD